MPTPDANADVTGDAIPMHQHHMVNRPQVSISPHLISFCAGLGVAFLAMYLCSQLGNNKKSRD